MDHEEVLFQEFLGSRMRGKGVSLKRLGEATGIAPSHLENMLHGNFDDMPSTPYFRGYVMRLGKVLDFNGEEWWEKIKKESVVKNSGPTDSMPHNRFVKKSIPKLFWVGIVVAVLLIIYLAFQFPRVFGKPDLVVTYPTGNPYTTASSTITLTGTVQNADVLYLSNGDASSSEQIAIGQGGSWQETVLLQNGLNTFEVSAKKLLGKETDITEQIIYNSPFVASSTATSTVSSSIPVTTSTNF
jgi:cytoskeletal protein RodZ